MAVKKFVVYSFIESSGCGQLEFLLVAMDSTIDMGQSGIKTTPVQFSAIPNAHSGLPKTQHIHHLDL